MFFVVIFLALNFLTSASDDALTWPKWAYMTCIVLFMVYTDFDFTFRKTDYSSLILRQYGRVLVLVFVTLGYTFLLACVYNYHLYDWVTDFWGFIPLLLSFSFASLFTERKQWLQIFSLLILLGVASSMRDLVVYGSSSEVVITNRLVSLQMANVDFFVAANICIGFLIFYENRVLFRLSLVSLPVLLYRTFLTGNRSMVILLSLGVLTMLAKRLFVRKDPRSGAARKSHRLGLSFAALIFAASTVLVMGGDALQRSVDVYSTRFELMDTGAYFRLIEANVVWNEFREHPLGAGFGSSAYFPGTEMFTAEAMPYKTWVHNLFLYCMWKLGVFGIIVFVLLTVRLAKVFKWTWKKDDALPFIACLLVIQYVAYAMVETYYRRHDYNMIIGLVCGFLIYNWNSRILATSKVKRDAGAYRDERYLPHTATKIS